MQRSMLTKCIKYEAKNIKKLLFSPTSPPRDGNHQRLRGELLGGVTACGSFKVGKLLFFFFPRLAFSEIEKPPLPREVFSPAAAGAFWLGGFKRTGVSPGVGGSPRSCSYCAK